MGGYGRGRSAVGSSDEGGFTSGDSLGPAARRRPSFANALHESIPVHERQIAQGVATGSRDVAHVNFVTSLMPAASAPNAAAPVPVLTIDTRSHHVSPGNSPVKSGPGAVALSLMSQYHRCVR